MKLELQKLLSVVASLARLITPPACMVSVAIDDNGAAELQSLLLTISILSIMYVMEASVGYTTMRSLLKSNRDNVKKYLIKRNNLININITLATVAVIFINFTFYPNLISNITLVSTTLIGVFAFQRVTFNNYVLEGTNRAGAAFTFRALQPIFQFLIFFALFNWVSAVTAFPASICISAFFIYFLQLRHGVNASCGFYFDLAIIIKFFCRSFRYLREYLVCNWQLVFVWLTGYFYWAGLLQIVNHISTTDFFNAWALTHTILTATVNIAIAPLLALQSNFGNLIRENQIVEMRKSFYRNLSICFVIYVIGLIIVLSESHLNFMDSFKLLKIMDAPEVYVLSIANFVFLSFPIVGRMFGGEPYFFPAIYNNMSTPTLLACALFFDDSHAARVMVVLNLALVVILVMRATHKVASATVRTREVQKVPPKRG